MGEVSAHAIWWRMRDFPRTGHPKGCGFFPGMVDVECKVGCKVSAKVYREPEH